MKIEDAKFLLMEINAKIQHGKRPHLDVRLKLDKIRERIKKNLPLSEWDASFLLETHYKMTEPGRLKW